MSSDSSSRPTSLSGLRTGRAQLPRMTKKSIHRLPSSISSRTEDGEVDHHRGYCPRRDDGKMRGGQLLCRAAEAKVVSRASTAYF